MSTVNAYVGDGLQKNFTFSFPYLSPSHVRVFVNNAMQLNPMHYTMVGNTVYFPDAPGVDAAVEIKRTTSPLNPLVDFTDGSTLKADELDIAYLHNFYLGQEYADSFTKMLHDALMAIAGDSGYVMAEPDEVVARLVEMMLESASAATLQQRINDIDANAEAIITLGEGIQVQINTLAQGVAANVYVQATAPVPGVGGVPNPIPEGSRWYDTSNNNKPYIYLTGVWTSIEDPRIGQVVTDISVLTTNVNNNAAAIVTESFARSTQDTAFASTLALIGAQNAGQTAFIIDSNTVKIDSDIGDTLANRFTQLTAADGANSAAISSEETARVNADGVLTSTLTLLGAKNAGSTAFILNENTVKINSDGGDTVAQRFTSLSAADSANSASITTINTVTIPGINSDVTALEARYGVTLNVNNHITGFAQHNDGVTGSFVILADKFAIVAPGGTPGTPRVPFEIVGSKINMRGDVSISGSLLVNGSVVGAAIAGGTIGTTHIGPNSITTELLNAGSVTALKIEANAVTAEKINVTSLSAISANLGTVTAGTIQLPTTGWIRGGQTAYNTGTGFFLGYSTNAYKFSIGNSTSGNFITWDGTELVVRGNLSLGNYTASTDIADILLNAPTARSHYDDWAWVEVKKFKINKPGTLRCYFTSSIGSDAGGLMQAGEVRVKRDGTVLNTYNITSTSWSTLNLLITTGETSQYITLEYKSGLHNPVEPQATGITIKDVSLRGTIDFGEDVITD